MATTKAATDAVPAPAATPATGPVATVTERGADGWPSAETPAYLIPGMGSLPVSSTAHFRTVVMTSLGDADLTGRLWPRLRVPLLRALAQAAARSLPRLVVQRAIYGDFDPDLIELPDTAPADVLPILQQLVGRPPLQVRVDNQVLGDPAPNRAKSLEVRYRIEGLAARFVPPFDDTHIYTARSAEGDTLVIPRAFSIVKALWGEIHRGNTVDVTAKLQSMIRGRELVLGALPTFFDSEFAELPDAVGRVFLEVDYLIDGQALRQTYFFGDPVRLPGTLKLESARYGQLQPPGTIDVTQAVAQRVDQERSLVVTAFGALFGDPAPNIVKKLRVDFTLGGVAGSRVVLDGERLVLGADPAALVDATTVHQDLFEPPPASVADLARRLTQRGLKATDLDPAAPSLTMEEVIQELVGLAPDDQLDPLLASADAIDSPAEGVLLHHEQGWFARGLALGNLLHSVALAPGEVTQIAMTHWNHTTRATDSETVSQQDSSDASDTQDRAVSEIQRAAADEHASGASFGASVATSAQAGISSFFGSASAGTASNLTTAVSHSDGSRNVAMDSNQRISAVTQRHAEAARTRRATVVREVTQSEEQTLTTRVLANYNHMHALTIMYFEVIEVFDLKTRVVDAERLVFLPFRVRDVHELVPRWRAVLVDAANAVGRADLAEALRHHAASDAPLHALAADIARLEGTPAGANPAGGPVAGEISRAEARRTLAHAESDVVRARFATQRAGLQGRITELDTQRAQVVAAFKDVPDALGSIAAQAVETQFRAIDRQVTGLRAQIDAAAAAEQRALADARADLAASEREVDALHAQLRRLQAAQRVLAGPGKRGSLGALDDNRLFFNQAVWLSLSPAEVLGLARRRGRFRGELLAEQIDPAPVAVTGNSVAYRWRFADAAQAQTFRQRHAPTFADEPERERERLRELVTVTSTIAAPTGGVFGEAVLGQAVSAEKIDLSRFWNWQDSMIPILPTGINALNAATPGVQNLSAEPGKLDESSARLGALADLPAPAGFNALAETLRAQLARDMSGQSMLQALAEATGKAAASGSLAAGEQAAKNFAAGLAFAKDIAPTVLEALAAPETGGASLLAGKLGAGTGGGTSLLGGLLSAGGAKGASDLLSAVAGGKAGAAKTADKAEAKAVPAKRAKAPKPLPKIPVSKNAEPVPPAPADPPADPPVPPAG